MQELILKPTHKLVKSYYETLGEYGQRNFDHEMAVRSAFQALLRGGTENTEESVSFRSVRKERCCAGAREKRSG